MEPSPLSYSPSVLTSEAYNEAEVIFTMLQNKEKLISFLDCTTVLRAMGMNPTTADMDRLKVRMAEPVLLLEQWRREEELKRDKERRKDEARERRGTTRGSVAKRSVTSAGAADKGGSAATGRQSAADPSAGAADKAPVAITPAEEVKNIDWNIFISCAEEMYRNAATEQAHVLAALRDLNMGGPSKSGFQQDSPEETDLLESDGEEHAPGWVAVQNRMTLEELIRIVTTNGDNVLSTAEVKQLRAALPLDSAGVDFTELAARLQGTYSPPSAEELARIAAAERESAQQQEEAAKAAANADPLENL